MQATTKDDRKNIICFASVIAIIIMATLASLAIGKYPISISEIFEILGGGGEDLSRRVFFTLRVPRTIMAAIAGFGLSVAGNVYQIIFKNPLAAPDIIGVSSGANAGAAFAIIFLSSSAYAIVIGSLVGGLIAVFLTMVLTGVSNSNRLATFVLSGVAINAIAQSIVMTLKLMADPEQHLASIEYWVMGSFSAITSDNLVTVVPITFVGITALFILRWQIGMLSLDDDDSKALGVQVTQIRYLVLFFATLTVAGIVSTTGLISFIGLIGPHIARLILRTNTSKTTIFSGLVGMAILLIGDILARSVHTSEIPISIITSMIGAPLLIFLVVRREDFRGV